MIGSVSQAPGTTPKQSMGELGGLGSEAFLKLLVAQLRYQNPMAPSDPGAMLQQTAQFTQVETLKQVASVQQQLLGLSQATISASLVGKAVTAVGAAGAAVQGTVDGIRFTEQGPVLLVGEHVVPLEGATEIRTATSTTSDGTTSA